MNPISRLLSLGALLLAPALFAADPFVGKIDMTMTGTNQKDGKPLVMTYSIKQDAMRIDMQGMPGSTIFNIPKREMLILMPEQKMYMSKVIDPADIPAQDGAKDDKASNIDIEDTGKTEVICGYTCHQFLVKDGKNVTEMWLAQGLGAFMGMGNPMGGGGGMGAMFGKKKQNTAAAAKWEQALKGKGGFPLRVVTHEASGKDSFKMEATKVEKGGVSDADFAPPAGWQEFKMPNFGDMFKRS
ncbi:MAG TPA: DUF4412 domain-containing protein [Candidatus Didemnitutus sp.]|nr:DUF4412 domain-containing protein [Candidatus Didemnitutus sp.]